MTDRDPRAASPAASPARIPTPDGGLGSHELEIDSDDPAVLRQALQRARERLAFYEGFDRIIGENIRRSGELMLETIALREDAQAAEQARIARETEIEAAHRAERDRTQTLLTTLQDEIAGFQASTASLASRVAEALRTLDTAASQPDTTAPTGEPATPEQATSPAIPTPEPMPTATSAGPATQANVDPATTTATPNASPAEPEAAVEPSPAVESGTAASPTATKASFRPIRREPTPAPAETIAPPEQDQARQAASPDPNQRTIDLIVNGITRATDALAFQRALSGRPGILHVETREFAEGVLRLKVDSANDDALADATFTTWAGPGMVQVRTRQPTLIALDLIDA